MLDASRMLEVLADRNVEYVVIGGLAMVTHGSALVTEDLDLCYRRNSSNMDALAGAIAPFRPSLRGAPAKLPFTFDAATIKAGLNFTLNTDLGPLDLLGEVPGLGDYEAVLRESELHKIYGFPVRVLSLDGLIASKKAAGRAKDQIHLLELEELKKLKP